MKVFESKSCSDIQVVINPNGGLMTTIDIQQDDEIVVISEKSLAIEFALYILKVSGRLED